MRDVVSSSDVVISTVPPASALLVAHQVAAQPAAARPPIIYVDANSVSPITMRRIGEVLRPPNFMLVDATIHGLAARLTDNAVMYLSGPTASEAAAIIGEPPRMIMLGDEVGQASLLKMLLGGTSKGFVALLLELSDLADREGMLDDFWAECRRFYPGLMESFERLLPTYGEHVGRRIQEMGELELTQSAAGRDAIMATAVRNLFSSEARSPTTLQRLVERMSAAAVERLDPDRGEPPAP